MSEYIVKVALIGCGRIAGHHIRSIITVDHCELIAISDLIEEKRTAYSDEFHVPSYKSYR